MDRRRLAAIRMRDGREGLDFSTAPIQVGFTMRGVPPGGLTRDVDTGRLFRRP
jgi:hypothetical protein